MPAGDVQIHDDSAAAAPKQYVVPGSADFILKCVDATFDGTSAAGSFIPCVEIYSDSGRIVARGKAETAVAAGSSAQVSFFPFNRAPGGGCCNTTSPGYPTTVANTNPVAFWPFDESSGTTAHDATGNGWDLTVSHVGPVGGGNWAWAQPAGPPGTQAPFTQGNGPLANNNLFPSHTDNFALATWVNVTDKDFLEPAIMRQGDPYGNAGNGGIALHMSSPNQKFYVLWSDGATYGEIDADAVSSLNAWHFVGAQRNNGTMTLWVDGVQQSTTSAHALKAIAGVSFAQDNAGSFYLRGHLSYGLFWDRPLTAQEWVALASPGGNIPAHYVLQSNGGGSTTWAPLPSGTAPAGYRLTADGVGGTYWAP